MRTFFQLCSLIHSFNLASILRSIAFPFVLLYVTYFHIIDSLSTFTAKLNFPPAPKVYISPLSDLYTQLNSQTVKNLREITGIKKKLTKAALIEAYLVTH